MTINYAIKIKCQANLYLDHRVTPEQGLCGVYAQETDTLQQTAKYIDIANAL